MKDSNFVLTTDASIVENSKEAIRNLSLGSSLLEALSREIKNNPGNYGQDIVNAVKLAWQCQNSVLMYLEMGETC